MSLFTKIFTLLSIGALVSMPVMAQRGGSPGTRGSRRPGGGRPGRPAGGPFANATFANITCSGDIDYSCDPHGESEDGVFVCRSWTNDEGVERSRVRCIPTNRSIEGVDECGCCGNDCPVACDTCPCTARRERPGAYVLDEDDEDPICLPLNLATMMVYKRDDVSCLADCSLAE